MEEPVEWVTLYRAVSVAELEDVRSRLAFRAIPSSMEGKWFAFEEAHARRWASRFASMLRAASSDIEPSEYWVVSIDVPHALVNVAHHHQGRLDQFGSAVFFDDLERLSREFRNLIVIGSV